MSETKKAFPFAQFEPQWQQHWAENDTFHTPNPGDADFDATKPKYFILDMFPYPSGAGLHVGHPEGYTATDILGRYKRMNGHNVLHPMGWDAFGLPAEQYAIKTGQHPRITTEANINNFRKQLQALGFAYDWKREINTTDADYVRWTQWIFLQLYNSYFCEKTNKAQPISQLEGQGLSPEQIDDQRLAFIHEAPVNWSPDLGTVLANEEIEEWKAKGHTVERRPLRQWMLRITKYAQRLIDDLAPLDWPDSIKALQTNWIGKSTGAEVTFNVAETSGLQAEITVFTTRPDTLFGATYIVLAPEHPLVAEITTAENKEAVEAYISACASKSDMDRGELNKDKTGIPTGAHAINPANGEAIPIWIADYVMMGYGTGAIMAVPAHDERDYEFAQKFELAIKQVVGSGSVGNDGVPPSFKKNSTPDPAFLSPKDPIHKTKIKLPHWSQKDTACFVTWRTADSLPKDKCDQITKERTAFHAKHTQPWSDETNREYHQLFSDRVDGWLDNGTGDCQLKQPKIRDIISKALQHFNGERYQIYSFVIMPNHVHVLFSPSGEHQIQDILQSWKSFTAKEINKTLDREGNFWMKDYYDRLIRSADHFDFILDYIRENPVKAGLVDGDFEAYSFDGKFDDGLNDGGTPSLPTSGNGVAINSGFLDGLKTKDAKKKMIDWLEAEGTGARKIQFKLRDWLFSRQRYWGEPFPLLWDKETGEHKALDESELPLLQPEMEDFKPTGDPRGPLLNATDWINYSDQYTRETNTMPQWAGSCWYYLRYCDPKNTDRFVSKAAEQYWGGSTGSEDPTSQGFVDLYVGGTEHAVLHLLYARFWHKVLHDLGHLDTNEPFQKLVNQGLILGEDGQKMSKSLGNVVNPDDVVSEYGADSLRLYEMFMGPLEQVKPWQMKGVEGVYRFLAKIWRVAMTQDAHGNWALSGKVGNDGISPSLTKITHQTIKKVGQNIETLKFNTAISTMMECVNAYTAAKEVPADLFVSFLKVLNPFAPHLTEELNKALGNANLLSEQDWPAYDEAALVESEIQIIVQVNGKLRAKLQVPADISKDDLETQATAHESVQAHTEGKTIRKVIVVPGKLVSIVAN